MPLIEKHHTDRMRAGGLREFARSTAKSHYPPDLGLEPVHAILHIDLDISERRASLKIEHALKANRGTVREIKLHGVDLLDLRVDCVTHDVSFQYDSREITVRFDEPFEEGEERVVSLEYEVLEPSTGMFFSNPDDFEGAGYWVATDHESERARHWFATIDLPAVKPTLEFYITADSELTILANGMCVDESSENGRKTAHWRLDYPCPSYITTFAVGDFAVFDDGEFEGRGLKYFAKAGTDPEDLERSFGRTGKMLAWMTEKLDAEFPFSKYYQFALPGIGGAMENISLVSWDEIFVLDEPLAKEWTWLLDQINVHEMAHSYFGDAIVCRDFAHAWLKESWATYIETCWLEDTRGEDEKLYDLYRNAHAYFEESDSNYKRPIVTRKFESSWDMYDRHLYPGGACRLHTLRNELGDEVFWRALRDYVDTYMGEVVETDDFRRIMEKHSGRSLGKFFDQWLHTAGYPDLEFKYSWNADASRVELQLEQKQATTDDGDGPVFDLSLALAFGFDDSVERREIEIDRAKKTFGFDLPSEPDWVQIDPGWTSLHKLTFDPGREKLIAGLEHGDVLGRIHAAKTLAEKPRRAAIEAIEEAYERESFWGCKREFVGALASAATSTSIEALARCIENEKDPMVLDAVMAAAEGLRDPRIQQALERRLGEGIETPLAASNALAALGSQAVDPEAIARYRVDDTHDFVAWGAARGYRARRDAGSLSPIAAIVDERTTYWRARAMAAMNYGQLAALLDDPERTRARLKLEDWLRDPDAWVAKHAARGLAAMGATESVARIEVMSANLSHQERVEVGRIIESLRKAADNPVAAIRGELDELTQKYRKLEERLSKIEDS